MLFVREYARMHELIHWYLSGHCMHGELSAQKPICACVHGRMPKKLPN